MKWFNERSRVHRRVRAELKSSPHRGYRYTLAVPNAATKWEMHVTKLGQNLTLLDRSGRRYRNRNNRGGSNCNRIGNTIYRMAAIALTIKERTLVFQQNEHHIPISETWRARYTASNATEKNRICFDRSALLRERDTGHINESAGRHMTGQGK